MTLCSRDTLDVVEDIDWRPKLSLESARFLFQVIVRLRQKAIAFLSILSFSRVAS